MRNRIIAFLLITMTKLAIAQDTIIEYNDWAWYKVDKNEATYKKVIFNDTANQRYNVKIYWTTGELKMTGFYSNLNPEEYVGKIIFYHKNGVKESEADYQVGYVNSDYFLWDEKGYLKQKKHFTGGVPDGEWIIYYDGSKSPKQIIHYKTGIKEGENARFYKNGNKFSSTLYSDGKQTYECGWYENGNKKYEMNYFSGKLNDVVNYWYYDGSKQYSCFYENGIINGSATGWYPDGTKKREETFNNGELKEGKCFSQEGKKIDYFPFLTSPSYKGGEIEMVKYLSHNIVYPSKAYKNGISRIVYVDFVIDENGNIIEPEIDRKGKVDLDQEALRVISSMPKWIPATIDGEPEKFWYRLPIKYTIK